MVGGCPSGALVTAPWWALVPPCYRRGPWVPALREQLRFGPCVTASSAGVLSSRREGHQGRVRGADGEMGGKEHRAGGGGEDVMGKQGRDTSIARGAQSPGLCFPASPLCWLCREEGPLAPHSHPHPSYGAERSAEAVGNWPPSWASPSVGEKPWQRPVYRGLLAPGRAAGRRTWVTFFSHLPAKAQLSSCWGLGSEVCRRQGAGGRFLLKYRWNLSFFFFFIPFF